MKTLYMPDKLHARCVTLKKRVDRLDDLFYDYVKSGDYKEGYVLRIKAAKAKLRNDLGIYLGVIL